MNQLVEQQIKQIRASVEELREILRETRLELREKNAAYVKLTQQYWSRTSKIAVLGRNEADYQALADENDRWRENEKALRERLERVLGYTKALQAEFEK